jgi:hypothetical protein
MDFLQEKIFDAHVHIFDASCLAPNFNFPPKSCYNKFGDTYTLQQCLDCMKATLPENEIYQI